MFTDERETLGTWNNEQYEAVAINHRPDHLALLPEAVGACSWGDGCGVRVNKKGGNMETKDKKEKKLDIFKEVKEFIKEGLSVFPITNEQGYQELIHKIQDKLDAMDTDAQTYYLQELWGNDFVYRVSTRNGLGSSSELYRRNYTIDANEVVTFSGDPVLVRREVNYVNVNKLVRTKGVKTMEKNEGTPCCPDKVKALIANKLSKFTEKDEPWLLTQTEETLEKLTPIEVKEEPKGKPQVNQDDIKKAVKAYMKENPEAYKEFLSKDILEQQEHGIRLVKEERQVLVKSIQDNAEKVWTDEELEAMPMDMLQKVSASIKPVVDYSGVSTEKTKLNANKEEDLMLPAGVTLDEGKEEK